MLPNLVTPLSAHDRHFLRQRKARIEKPWLKSIGVYKPTIHGLEANRHVRQSRPRLDRLCGQHVLGDGMHPRYCAMFGMGEFVLQAGSVDSYYSLLRAIARATD